MVVDAVCRVYFYRNFVMAYSDQHGCRQDAGQFIPVIDRNRCLGKGECLSECPYDVFELKSVPGDARGNLSAGRKMKAIVHGWKQAYTPREDACRVCGFCVAHCPEKAITLQRA
jgi:4Fe-4S ferredoxin